MIGCILYGLSSWGFVGLILALGGSSFQYHAHKSKMTRGMSFGEKFYWKPDERAQHLQSCGYRILPFALIAFGIGVFIEFFGLPLGLFSADTVCPSWVQTPQALRLIQ